MRVLVTGAAGFIGSHVVDELVAEHHEVVGLDWRGGQAPGARPGFLNDAAGFVEADLRDRDALSSVVRGVDAVSHQAAKVGLGESFSDVTDYVGHNDGGTAALLHALFASGFKGRLVLAGSMVVYGEGGYLCEVHGDVRPGPRARTDLAARRFDPRCPECGSEVAPVAVTEDLPVDPRNVYAATKLHQEHLCTLFGRETGASVALLRYHNVYGPRMPRDTAYSGVPSIFLSALERGEPPEVFEDGRQLRDFVHVADVARANVLALLDSAVTGAFNVSTGRPRTVYEMATELGRGFEDVAPARITGGYRLGDVRHVFASPRRAGDELGWRAKVDFAAGMHALAEPKIKGKTASKGASRGRFGAARKE